MSCDMHNDPPDMRPIRHFENPLVPASTHDALAENYETNRNPTYNPDIKGLQPSYPKATSIPFTLLLHSE
jgi:hypothetical protein